MPPRRYFQLYSDDRGVCRIYEMSIDDGEWNLWRQGEPFAQRFTGRFEDDAATRSPASGSSTSDGWKIDFDLTYRRVN